MCDQMMLLLMVSGYSGQDRLLTTVGTVAVWAQGLSDAIGRKWSPGDGSCNRRSDVDCIVVLDMKIVSGEDDRRNIGDSVIVDAQPVTEFVMAVMSDGRRRTKHGVGGPPCPKARRLRSRSSLVVCLPDVVVEPFLTLVGRLRWMPHPDERHQ
jgi:hypothetical protein